jgi:carbamoyl-phosphate synthase large subunit
MKIKKVIILGSGAIKIGEAGEFDYSGAQAIKALKEEGVKVVLINPNIATIQTDTKFADEIYLLPVNVNFVEEVIKKEKPDGILLGFGGQTALNAGVESSERGILKKYGVKVLGTSVKAIETCSNREKFRKTLLRNNISIARSKKATSLKQAKKVAKKIGYPVMIRVAYTLGGSGSGVAKNEKDLKEIVSRGLTRSRISQVLVEEYLGKWKEVEYEVMRDKNDNCTIVCNMENFDPIGIHTGESIVVAPSQTLTNRDYHLLRIVSFKVIRALGIIGECNIQFAYDPESEEYRVIEVNPRLSRSSALASKATGYPIAYIAAKLALGYTLPDLMNKVTQITTACFEPALDYCVVKIPRWDFRKFRRVKHRIGTQMQSVGEVMAIGRCFEEALQKAVRMLNTGRELTDVDDLTSIPEEIDFEIENPSDLRIFYLIRALKQEMSINRIHELSGIDVWFLDRMKNIVEMEKELTEKKSHKLLRDAKIIGFSDKKIGELFGKTESEIRKMRKRLKIIPVVNQIDTMAAEWPAKTNYLYLNYGGQRNDIVLKKKKRVIVLGSGTYCIGSSVEFDWCCVNCAWALKEKGFDEVVMINYNPETVSTDFDVMDKLYFEELTLERVLDIVDKEKPYGVVVSAGGQIPNNLALKLAKNGVKILGTSAKNVDKAEDRAKFSSLLDALGIKQSSWKKLEMIEQVKKFSEEIGYPVLVRPSYVLSGAAMNVAFNEKDLENYVKEATNISTEYPVVVSKFIDNAREVEVDGVCNGKDVFIGAIIEHVENAGIHSGDATMSIPTLTISRKIKDRIREYSKKIATALRIKGPFNIQYIVKGNDIFVIECNLRASRSMPFVSKVIGINLMKISVDAMLGEKIPTEEIIPDYYGVKVPQFSFMRLYGADPTLGVEMVSTGEVACLGKSFSDAFLKGLIASGISLSQSDNYVLVTLGKKKHDILPVIKRLQKNGSFIYSTEHTGHFLKEHGIPTMELYKISEDRKPNINDYLVDRKINLVINIPMVTDNITRLENVLEDEYKIRRTATEFGIPVFTNFEIAKAFVDAITRGTEFSIESLNEFQEGVS